MIRRVARDEIPENVKIPITGASFPSPFPEGLEYSPPARGVWNIAHMGMLIPEAHEVFVCALGCLRGVVLTAAEMNALDRYSAIEIREENIIDGGMENLMIDGVADIIHKSEKRPKAILIYISCQHFFQAYDQELVFSVLRERFPDIYFLDCYMIPTLRKSGMPPDQRMRAQMYRMWENLPKNSRRINLIGSDLPIAPTSELLRMVEDAGFEFWDIHRCGDFSDYMNMAESALNLICEPAALLAAKDLKERIGQEYLYLPFSFDLDELEGNYQALADRLGIEKPDFSGERKRAEAAIIHAGKVIGDAPIAVDATFTFRILSFARMLLEHGFLLTEIYADAFAAEDEANFTWIREHHPEVTVSATSRPAMRFLHYSEEGETNRGNEFSFGEPGDMRQQGEASPRRTDEPEEKNETDVRERNVLAIGQKAAYFAATDHFVNVAESGGYYGFDGIVQIMELMEDAWVRKKDRRSVIQRKAYGCESCL